MSLRMRSAITTCIQDSMEAQVLPAPSIEETKLFLGGLPQESTIESLSAYFQTFGDVYEVEIMKDPVTKRSRGFGFVKFMKPESAAKVSAKGKDHYVDGKKIEVKIAYKKGEEAAVQAIIHNRKIFVGGLTKEMTEEKLKEYFSQYGPVVGVDIKKEKGTDLIRGFGFVEFKTRDAVDVLLLKPFHSLSGKQIEVKKVEPKEKTRPAHKLNRMQGYEVRGGGGAMRGRGGRGSNYYQPYGGNYTTYGNNNYGAVPYGGGGEMYGGGPGYAGYSAEAPTGYGPPPPGPPPPPPPGQYGYPAQPQGGRGAGGYAGQQQQQQVGGYAPPPAPPQDTTNYVQNRPAGTYNPGQPGAEVGYPPNVGYNNYGDQSTGYQQQQQQQQQQYYDAQQGANTAGGYGRGTQPSQRGGYYGGQWTT